MRAMIRIEMMILIMIVEMTVIMITMLIIVEMIKTDIDDNSNNGIK